MQDTLVTFETAKLAQEKGFNYPCSIVFDDDNKVIDFREQAVNAFIEDCETGCTNKGLNYFKEGYNRTDDNKDLGYFITRPSQSHLQKWLREVYKIEVIVAPKFFNDGSLWYCCECFIVSLNNKETLDNLFRGVFTMCKTHEEALEIGLLEGLELIKYARNISKI